jgi:hypothetical protein
MSLMNVNSKHNYEDFAGNYIVFSLANILTTMKILIY